MATEPNDISFCHIDFQPLYDGTSTAIDIMTGARDNDAQIIQILMSPDDLKLLAGLLLVAANCESDALFSLPMVRVRRSGSAQDVLDLIDKTEL